MAGGGTKAPDHQAPEATIGRKDCAMGGDEAEQGAAMQRKHWSGRTLDRKCT